MQGRPVGNGHVLVYKPAANSEQVYISQREIVAHKISVPGQVTLDKCQPPAQLRFARLKKIVRCRRPEKRAEAFVNLGRDEVQPFQRPQTPQAGSR